MTVRHRSVAGRPWDRVLKEYTKSIFFAIFLAVLIRATLVQAYHIPSASMENTLLVGDYVLGDKLTFGTQIPDRLPLLNVKLPPSECRGFETPDRATSSSSNSLTIRLGILSKGASRLGVKRSKS